MIKTALKISGYILIGLTLLIGGGLIWVDYELDKILGTSVEEVNAAPMITNSKSSYIKNVSILSEDCTKFIPNQNVFIEDGVILSISDTIIPVNSSTSIFDGTNKYLIPGLVDSHVHLQESRNDLLLYLANGVTSVREMMGRPVTLDWKETIQRNGIGPKLFIASPPIYSESGLKGYYTAWTRKAINYSSRKKAEVAIKEISDMGYDAIKMYGFVNKEMLYATTEIAKKYNIPVVGHIPDVGLSDFFKSGQSEVAHIEEFVKKTMIEFNSSVSTNPESYLEYHQTVVDEISQKVKSKDIVVTTTVWLNESIARQRLELDSVLKTIDIEYVNPKIIEGTVVHKLGWLPGGNTYEVSEEVRTDTKLKQKDIIFWDTYLKALYITLESLTKHDVTILVGTDANAPTAVPGFSLHQEFESLSKAGMTNAQILYGTTAAPNEWMKSKSGKIKVSYDSDLVLLSKNPLENIRNTQAIEHVFFNTHSIDKDQINEILGAVNEINNSNRKIDISEFEN